MDLLKHFWYRHIRGCIVQDEDALQIIPYILYPAKVELLWTNGNKAYLKFIPARLIKKP